MPSARLLQGIACTERLLLWLALGLALPLGAQTWNWGYDPNWASHISVGAMVGFNIKADFKINGAFTVPTSPGVYDDGYVHPVNNGNGFTSNWGYQNQSQYDPSSQTMTMHQITGFEVPGSSQSVNADPAVGFQAAYGGNFWYVGRARIGWEFGFGWLPLSITANGSGSGTADQSSFAFKIPNQLNGQPQVIPDAPYFQNGSGQTTLAGTPAATNHVTGQPAALTGSQTLDVNLFTFRLGPSVYWDFNRHVGMSLGAGPALGYVPGTLKYNVSISTSAASGTGQTVTAKSQGSINVSDVVYGWYVNTKVLVHLVKNGDLFVGAEYMPLGTATLGGAGSQASLNLKGQIYVTAGINWPF